MGRKRYFRTDFLFPRSNYITGAGSIIALMGNYYRFNASNTAENADLKALRSNWGVVGNDFHTALKLFQAKNKRVLRNQ